MTSARNGESTESSTSQVVDRRYLPLIAVIFALGYTTDQVTKFLAVRHLDPANPPSFFGGLLKLRLVFNPGAAFGMGSSFTVFLSLFAILALGAVVFVALPRVRGLLPSVIVAFLLVGISGNLTDRLFRAPGPLRGHVVDFFAFPNFAIFNVADIFVTSAAVLLVLATFKRESTENGV